MLNINKTSEFKRNILKMFTSSLLAQIITVFGSLLLARLYSPAEFGTLSIFISILSISTIIISLRYETAFVIEKTDKLIKHLLNFIYIYSCFIFFVIIIILSLFSDDLLFYLKISNFYYLIPLSMIIYAYLNIFTHIHIKNKNFSTIAKSKIILAISIILLQIIFYYIELNNGLLIGFILGYLISLIYIISMISNIKYLKYNSKKIAVALKKYFYIVKYGAPADFINNLSVNILPILISMWFDLKLAGLYFLSYRIINLPLQLISLSISKVFFQRASEIYSNEKTKLYNFTVKVVVTLSIFIFFPLIILFFFSNDIIIFLLGREWEEAGSFITILVFLFFFRTLFSPISNLAEILNKMNIIFYFSLFILITNIISMYIAHIYNNFILGIILISFFSSLGYLYLLIYYITYLKGIRNAD